MSKRRPAGDGLVRKRSDGRWEGRIVVGHKSNGEPIYKSVFGKTQKELLPKLHQSLELYSGADLTEQSRMTLGEWLDKWLDEYKSLTIRESTQSHYRALINNQIKPILGDKPLSSVTPDMVQRMHNRLKHSGRVKADQDDSRELSDSMVRSVHMLLHEAMDTAVQEHLIVRNPTMGTVVPKQNHPPMQVLNEEQLERFQSVAEGDEVWRDFFYTELTTGLRRGEICGLQWADFDADAGILKVRRTVYRKKGGEMRQGDTKTATGYRTILLPPSTAERLRQRKKSAVSEWIFPNPLHPEQCVNPNTAYQRMKTLLKSAGLPPIRFHDLRHTFATHALSNGVDAKTLAGILGHTNASFTLDTYTHVTTGMQKNAAGIVDGFLTELFGEELKPWQKREKREQAPSD